MTPTLVHTDAHGAGMAAASDRESTGGDKEKDQLVACLDATASCAAGIASVDFEVSRGPSNLNQEVGTAMPTIYGYILVWKTTTVPNGTYNLQSVATDTVSETAPSAPVPSR